MSSERPDNKRMTARDAFNLARAAKDAQPKINLGAIAKDAGIARFDKRLRQQSGLFDKRWQKQMGAFDSRAFKGIADQVLGTGLKDTLKQFQLANVDSLKQARMANRDDLRQIRMANLDNLKQIRAANADALKRARLANPAADVLKQVSDQVGGQALKALGEQQKESGGLSSILEGMNKLSDFAPKVEHQTFQMDDSLRRIGEMHAREKREAIERELAMVNYLASVARSSQRAEAHEAAALERAEQAEKREQVAIARSEQIQRRSLWIAGVALVLTAISTTAAVLALFVV